MSYMLDQKGDPTERERLALLQSYYDAKTISHLTRLGVAPGWRCHDVGAGAGSIAQWLAQRVTPDGSVLAIDLDVTLLEPLASPVLSVRRHDIRREELPRGADLVHARLLLEHLPEAEVVLQRMVRALRAGGWLLLTDTDFRTVRFSEPEPAFERVASAFEAATRAAGWNTQFGPALPSMLEKAGLTDVQAECWQTYGRCGAPELLLARTYRRLREQLIRHGAKPAEVDHVEKQFASGAVGVFSPTSWTAWGRCVS
jgi:SAM-dependent methyltransferase